MNKTERNLDSVCSTCIECLQNAKIALDEAAVLEQDENWPRAIKKLEDILKKLDKILKTVNEVSSTSISTRDNLYSLTSEIESVRNIILDRVESCNQQLLARIESVAPPSYEEAMSTSTSYSSHDNYDGSTSTSHTSSSSGLSYSELGNVLENLKHDIGAQSAQLIYSCEDVTLYFISSSGTVSVSSGPDTVRIFEIEDGSRESLPKYYLQIYTFVYPLIPRVSPCVKTEFGAILFPNINIERSEESDIESIGLVVKKEKEVEFVSTLENILQTKIIFCDTKDPAHISLKISETLTTGATYVSNFLINGALKAGQFLDGKTPELINKIEPSHSNRKIAPCMSSGIKIAKDVTALTANVTGFVASRVGAATMLLGQYLAPHLRRGSTKILTNTVGMNENDASNKVEAVFNVTAGAVGGIATIYRGLEESAKIFGRSLSNNTVQVVTHKYGPSAGRFAENTFETVGNSMQIGTNIRFLKPNKIAKSAAKGTIISTVVQDGNSRDCRDSNPLPEPSTKTLLAETVP